MKKTRNIILTSISQTKNRLDMEYYVCEDSSGRLSYTDGITLAEAGIEYCLSRYEIDDIIVLGLRSHIGENEKAHTRLDDVTIDNFSDINKMSEYGFLCYRLAEFIHQINLELVDLEEVISEQQRKKLLASLNEFIQKNTKGNGIKDFFARICTDKGLYKKFQEEFYEELERSEQKWIKNYIFGQMDSYYKMHMLPQNKNTGIRYIELSSKNITNPRIVSDLIAQIIPDGKTDVSMYIDMQGMSSVDGYTMISTLLMLNERLGFNCNVKELIRTEHNPGYFCGIITDALQSYRLNMLISGIESFLNYGKDGELKLYWESLGRKEPEAEHLFIGTSLVDEGISLCNIELVAAGIEVIRNVLKEEKKDSDLIFTEIIKNAIKADFGALLEGDSLSIPELLKWSHRKGFYQQTLTIIESKIPEDMVKRGIYFYATNKEEREAFLKEMNVLYWNENSKSRYGFSDVDHYFIKYYGRNAIDYRQKPDAVAADYAKLRVQVLDESADGVMKAFSNMPDKDLLQELLYSYYRMGNLRNQVNHAIVDKAAVVTDGVVKRKDLRIELDGEINNFIALYEAACAKVVPGPKPVLLDERMVRGYTRNHEIQPLSESVNPDLTVTNHYNCSFSGQNILIDIRMLKPQPDAQPDDEE